MPLSAVQRSWMDLPLPWHAQVLQPSNLVFPFALITTKTRLLTSGMNPLDNFSNTYVISECSCEVQIPTEEDEEESSVSVLTIPDSKAEDNRVSPGSQGSQRIFLCVICRCENVFRFSCFVTSCVFSVLFTFSIFVTFCDLCAFVNLSSSPSPFSSPPLPSLLSSRFEFLSRSLFYIIYIDSAFRSKLRHIHN